MNRKLATIQDVARVAGVSAATVSRTLSNPSVVAEPTRQAVLTAVEQTGYRVNRTAAGLRRQRTGTVIALVPNLANPFFSQIFAALSATLTEANYSLLVADTQTGTDPDAQLAQHLGSGQADGLILFDGSLSTAPLSIPGRPPVIAACEWLGADIPSVQVENALGAALAVRHLAGRGHRAIGHVTGPRGNVLAESRLEGFRRAMTDLGLPLRDDWIFEGDYSMRSGAAVASRILSMRDRPSALFFSSDEMAIGFMGAAQKAGMAIPADMSVVGFDNIEVCEHLSPALTTIRQQRRLIGERAARLLLAMIEDRSHHGQSERIPVELIERSSTAPVAL